MPDTTWSMEAIESLDRDAFVAVLGSIFEGSPWIEDRVWASRPWGSAEALHAAMVNVVANAGRERQLALIRAHPDLVGKDALAGSLARESTAEQRAAGLDPGALTAAEIERFQTANAAYREKFGFPFVICARENRKASILASLAERIEHDREDEVQIALAEIGKIAWLRLTDLIAEQHNPSPKER